MTTLIDAFGRRITYLRVSVTDKCNLRCVYCMPEHGVKPRSHYEILRLEEIARVVRVAAGLGITKVRITGGEPLVRNGLVQLVKMIASLPGLHDFAMTTNGTLLDDRAAELAAAGLKRVNISLDTLRPDVYSRITRCGDLQAALRGIAAAEAAGLRPIRLNAVVVRGVNDGEIEDLARLTLEHAWDVRFIELMPFWGNGGSLGPSDVVPIEEVRGRVKAIARGGALVPCHASLTLGSAAPTGRPGSEAAGESGPASYMRLPGALGRVGFISREGDGFCVRCNRLRLTADGKLLPCLLATSGVDLREPLRDGADDAAIAGLIRKAVSMKPESGAACGGVAGAGVLQPSPSLCEIGG